jgi:NAD(P)H-nitrite reductase large subunit
MLQDGDRGVVLQRNKKTYAIAPHLPCGLVTSDFLRKLADAADKYHAAAIKCTSAERIALIGLEEKDIDAAWADLGGPPPGYMTGARVRSVKACPGTQFCKRGRQDSLTLGLALDRLYIAKALPGKMKIGVSGCPNQCAETCIKDIGLVGGASGWVIYVGGMGGSMPRLAQPISLDEFSTEQALDYVEKVVSFFQAHARGKERLGEVLDRVKLKTLQQALALAVT